MTTARAEKTENKENTAVKPATEPTEAYNWAMVVELIQTTFREGKLV